MTWTEETTGQYSRSLGAVESVYRKISQAFSSLNREHWGLYCICALEFSSSVPNGTGYDDDEVSQILRQAWVNLMLEFPGLAVRPEGLTRKTYTAISPEDWAAKTFYVEPDSKCPDDILSAYPSHDLPGLYFFPWSGEVMLLVSHWRIDGLGTCMLMDRYMALAAAQVEKQPAHTFGTTYSPRSGVVHISPTLEEAIGSVQIGDDDETKNFARNYIADHHRNALHAGGLPFKGDAQTPPGASRRAEVVIGSAATSALAAACKANAFSVTSAIHAALATAIAQLSSADVEDTYSAVVSANLRPRLAMLKGRREHAVGVYVTGLTPVVDQLQSFTSKARKLASFYKFDSWCTPQFLRALPLIMRLHTKALFEGPSPPKPPSGVTLSSLGIIDGHLGSEYGKGKAVVKVTDFHFGVSILTRQVLLYAWTYNGRLTLSANYNGAYHDKGAALRLIHSVMSVLEKELGVSLDVEQAAERQLRVFDASDAQD
ncbi:hypothetical protein MGU_11498 [Metarhizium guizhouense ARSEF 977]|uniref:Alcohol acetyltransferase n=1 Tax=Metarhizium guizhouense (strain ARSEF 977) TaxID=1276136 RepID=A0A0B4GUF1_METGA|nr:hypothetical protein MGU_11498 [Metarhizium guizhouense ARSEF 977]